jgi:hypothetical protein
MKNIEIVTPILTIRSAWKEDYQQDLEALLAGVIGEECKIKLSAPLGVKIGKACKNICNFIGKACIFCVENIGKDNPINK